MCRTPQLMVFQYGVHPHSDAPAAILQWLCPTLSYQIGTDVLLSESHVVVVLAARNSTFAETLVRQDSGPAARMASCSYHDPTTVASNGCVSRKMSKSTSWIHLNVGGKVFMTTRQTLLREPQSFFSRLCLDDEALPSDQDETGAYLIDRDPKYFGPVLNWLRHGRLVLDHGVSEEGVLEEAEFYNMPTLVTIVQERIAEREEQIRKRYEESCNKKEPGRLRSVYRVMGCDGHDELTATVSQLTDGWKLVQVMVNANYAVDQSHEFLVIVTRECPDNDTPMDIQDRAGHIQQRARNN